ncbi:MAG: hypothetical protein LKM31_15825 [Sphingobium sp.]|nr:hypothetical protein [Sphingobium sp.]
MATSDAAFRGGACPTPEYTIAYTGNYTTSADANRAALADGRSAMAPERWRLLYAPKLEILERDILPRFPGAMLEAAARKPLPQLPPVE